MEKFISRIVLIRGAVLLMALGLSGCQSTATPLLEQPAPTPQIALTASPTSIVPTQTSIPTSTPDQLVEKARAFFEPILAVIAERPPDFEDDFSTSGRDWQFFEPYVRIENGSLEINVPEGETYGSAQHSQMWAPDFVFQIDVRADVLEDVPEHVSEVDILLREQASKGGSYSLSLYPQLAKWQIYDHVDDMLLATGGLPDQASMGQWMKIVVVARGNQFAIFINDQFIYYFIDDTLPDGQNKFGAGGPGGGRAEAKFDNVKFWNLDNVPGLP